MLLVFGPTMLLGALVTWVWIPEVQYPRGAQEGDKSYRERLKLTNRSLEEIARDPNGDQVIVLRKNLVRFVSTSKSPS